MGAATFLVAVCLLHAQKQCRLQARQATRSPPTHPHTHTHHAQWAALEGGSRALSFTSGMAALAAVTKLVGSGGHIVAGDDLYGGTSRLLSQVVPNAGVSVSNVDMTDIS